MVRCIFWKNFFTPNLPPPPPCFLFGLFVYLSYMRTNQKLKDLLKGLFENKQYESIVFDGELYFDDVNSEMYVDDEYMFRYTMKVGAVVGVGTGAVGDIQVIISSITRNGEDFYSNWKLDEYSSNTWYMSELEEIIINEYFDLIPFSIYITFYGHDEKIT